MGMGGRKFRLGRHRKNEERKLEPIPWQSLPVPSLSVSFPLASYLSGRVGTLKSLTTRLTKSLLSPSWIVASSSLTLCKLRVHPGGQGSSVDVSAAISIQSDLGWTLSIINQPLTLTMCPLLSGVPAQLSSVSAVCDKVSMLDLVNCARETEKISSLSCGSIEHSLSMVLLVRTRGMVKMCFVYSDL